MINFQVHGALEIFSLSVIACGCGVKLKWQGAKLYFTHKRTLFKVRGFALIIAHINCKQLVPTVSCLSYVFMTFHMFLSVAFTNLMKLWYILEQKTSVSLN